MHTKEARSPSSPQQHRGFVLAHLIGGLAIVTALSAVLGYTYLSLAQSTNRTQKGAQTLQLLYQAAYALAAQSADSDSDGVTEPPSGVTPSSVKTGNGVAAGEGWEVPPSSGAPRLDAWGTAFKYCVWDNGPTTNGSGRLAGDAAITTNSAMLAVISAGQDRIVQTSCASVRGALASPATDTVPKGDDLVRSLNYNQLLQGVSGTAFFGDPVANAAAFASVSAVPAGQMRVALDTGRVYVNATGAAGAASWAPADGSGAGAFPFPYIDKPVVSMSGRTASVSPLTSVLNLTDGGVQYQLYSSASLTPPALKDTGTLAAGASYDFSASITGPVGTPFYVVARRKSAQLSSAGTEVWSAYSDPVNASMPLAGFVASDGYAKRSPAYAAPSIVSPLTLPSSCPAGWVAVPSMKIPTAADGVTTTTVPAFCVMPFALVYTGGKWRTATPSNAYYNTVISSQLNVATTSTGCASVYDANDVPVTGATVITESQWLAIAHNIAGVGNNWSTYSVGNVADSSTLIVGPNHSPASTGLSATNPVRFKYLSTGAQIFDFGVASDYEWVVRDPTYDSTSGPNYVLHAATQAGPFAPSGSTSVRGQGYWNTASSPSNNFVRGSGGIFAAALKNPGSAHGRCTK